VVLNIIAAEYILWLFLFAAEHVPNSKANRDQKVINLSWLLRETPLRHGGHALLCIFKSGHFAHRSKLLWVCDEGYL